MSKVKEDLNQQDPKVQWRKIVKKGRLEKMISIMSIKSQKINLMFVRKVCKFAFVNNYISILGSYLKCF